MNKALNRKTSRILGALITAALVLVMIFSAFSVTTFARADDNENLTFTQTDVSPSNSNFANTGSGTPPSPDSWTGGGVDGLNGGNTVAGVMNLSTYAEKKDDYKLDKFYSSNTSPDSPFGKPNTEGNRNVLLINVLNDSTAYGYTSSSVTFTANRFYLVEAWVSTGKFASDSGAAIRVNGLGEDIVFNQIDTSATTDNYGWEKFSFYIASSSLEDKSVTLSLQVGDKYEDYFYPATGYAMFDNVSILEIAPSTFYEARTSAHTRIYDLSNKTSEKFTHLENLDFTQDVPDSASWVRTSAGEDMSRLTIGTYDAKNSFDENNKFHLTSDPYSSNGKYDKGDSSILVVSSYDGSQFRSAAMGVSSQPVTIERYRYYRISVWAKSQEVSEGNGATFALSAIRDESTGVGRYEGKNMFATITSCNGNAENKSRGGFSQYSFYVKGSALRDYDVNIECWLGTPDSKSRGIALFDNVTVEEITPADYTAYSASGTIVDIDTHAGIDGSSFVSYADTGITNGSFYEISAYEEFGYPFAPSGWTMYTASTAATTGYSVESVDTSKAISGIIPTDSETFDKYVDKFGGMAFNPANSNNANLLMLYSPERTAYCYRSSAFTATANTPGMLTVSLLTSGMTSADYGASLVLKNDSGIIATIEKIKTNNSFRTYTFYIEPASVDISSLSVEVWLGNIDRTSNTTKLSAGLIYVREVGYAAIPDDYASDGTTVTKSAAQKFSEYKAACERNRQNNLTISAAAYSFNGIEATAYDYYDSEFVKYPYNWQMSATGTYSNTVHYGIFDPASSDRNYTLVPKNFTVDELTTDNVLMLYNAGPASSTLTYNGSLNIAAEKYYKIDIALKVDIPENQERANAVGAKLTLSGDKTVSFDNIKDTSTVSDSIVNKETFKTYSFYVYPGDSDKTVSLSISLGDSAFSKQCNGRVYIGSISITDINSDLYNTASEEVKKRDDGKKYNSAYERVLVADYSVESDDDVTDTENPEGGSSLEWWLIPSILFAVAILIAIVGFIIRKSIEKHASKKGTVTKTVSYDRNATLNVEHNKNADDENKVSTESTVGDEKYESFDDDATVTESKSVKTETNTTVAPHEETPTDSTAENNSEEGAQIESDADASKEVTAEEKPAEESKSPAPDAFIDRFDD